MFPSQLSAEVLSLVILFDSYKKKKCICRLDNQLLNPLGPSSKRKKGWECPSSWHRRGIQSLQLKSSPLIHSTPLNPLNSHLILTLPNLIFFVSLFNCGSLWALKNLFFFFLTGLETNSACTVKLFFSFIQLFYSVLLLLLSLAMVKRYIEQWSNVKRGTSLTMAQSQYTLHPATT